MRLGEAVLLVAGIRNRCPGVPGSVPMRLTEKHREALSAVLDNITIVMGPDTVAPPDVCERDGVDLPCSISQEEIDAAERTLSNQWHKRQRDLLAQAGANSDAQASAAEAQRSVPVQ